MNVPTFNLDGQTALVTGAGRGIGKAIAIGLAQSGSDVVLVSRTMKEIEETAAYIYEQTGRKALALTADVTSREQLEETFREAISEMGSLDILVNNAGMNIRTPALEVTDEQWETIMQTNLKSAFFASQLAGQHMKERGTGKIINISSVGGAYGFADRRRIWRDQSCVNSYDQSARTGMGKVWNPCQFSRAMVFPNTFD